MFTVKFLKLLAALAVILLFGFYSLINKVGGSEKKELVMSLRDYLVSSFALELPEINKKLPHNIDNSTRLLSVEYLNGQVVSRYELIGVREGINSDPEFINQVEPVVKRQACLDEVKRKLLDVDVDFVNRYQDSKGGVLFGVLINKSACSGFGS